VCIQCGHVEEFHDDTIEDLQIEIALKHKFKLTDHSLCLYGICEACQTERS
jgi:Fur family ferric uptake transcriptional regulator